LDELRLLRDQGVKEVVLLGQNVNSYHDTSAHAIEKYPSSVYNAAPGFTNMFNKRDGAGMRFAELLAEVSEIDSEIRVRFTSPHPKDFPDDVLRLIAERKNICNALHLPAQSGSSSVLQRMRRGYTREAYLDLVRTFARAIATVDEYKYPCLNHSSFVPLFQVSRAREIIPDVGLSSDFISGFCGETKEEHQVRANRS
jgi:tRNA A37 methylthiotransferase MiaB